MPITTVELATTLRDVRPNRWVVIGHRSKSGREPWTYTNRIRFQEQALDYLRSRGMINMVHRTEGDRWALLAKTYRAHAGRQWDEALGAAYAAQRQWDRRREDAARIANSGLPQ